MLSQNYKHQKSWFTLIEILIVIAIIMILVGIGLFPYGYYMQRGYTERAADGLAQEWILGHKTIRSWIEFDPLAGKHAHLFFVFEKWKSEIESYLMSWSIVNINSLPINPLIIKKYKTFRMENGVEILNFTGSLIGNWDKIGYMIFPPFGDGLFFTGSTTTWVAMTGARITIWYPWAILGTGRSREILLRTYLK